MSEPASFLPYLGQDLEIAAIESGAPPVPPPTREKMAAWMSEKGEYGYDGRSTVFHSMPLHRSRSMPGMTTWSCQEPRWKG